MGVFYYAGPSQSTQWFVTKNHYCQKTLNLYIYYFFCIFLGLAVSDISLIQKEAQILSYVSRVEQIAFIESMLLGESLGIMPFRQLFQILQFFFPLPIGDPFRFLTNYPPFSWAQKLPPCDCFRSMYSLGPMRWLLNKMMGNTLLFTDRLKNKRHSIYIRTVSS